MVALELTPEQVLMLVKQLPVAEKYALLSALHAELGQLQADPDTETSEWLDAPLVDELPSYEWGEAGIPKGKPIRFEPDHGFVVEGGKSVG
ncbi:hypothetical protein GS597_13065 [Synechococcales cyanobacterium C]|uniref:Uncharacterized protein n=1 Tax=Petrachloros mirabilis ULC683 TaxID=2781853 RepID=A0A8K2A8T5_9CYAN|nr:hypothetical protein [Petrachloros mirabilis]NCJ07420.1 hypothetical protein [Petrachloros mirabilis ULC683]